MLQLIQSLLLVLYTHGHDGGMRFAFLVLYMLGLICFPNSQGFYPEVESSSFSVFMLFMKLYHLLWICSFAWHLVETADDEHG